MRRKGDIIEGTDRRRTEAYHYIIFYDGYDDNHFVGAMLTGKSNTKLNVPLEDHHFLSHDNLGQKYKIPSKPSFIVKAKLLKLERWGPFREVGRLSNSGINFLDTVIDQLDEELWEDYLRRTSQSEDWI